MMVFREESGGTRALRGGVRGVLMIAGLLLVGGGVASVAGAGEIEPHVTAGLHVTAGPHVTAGAAASGDAYAVVAQAQIDTGDDGALEESGDAAGDAAGDTAGDAADDAVGDAQQQEGAEAMTAEELATAAAECPVPDSNDNYRLGILRLYNQPGELAAEFGYISASVSQRVGEELADITDHYYSDAERIAYANYLRQRRIDALQQQIDQQLAARDDTLFVEEEGTGGNLRSSVFVINRDTDPIEDLRQEAACVQALPAAAIISVERKPIEVVVITENAPQTAPALRPFAVTNEYDMLIRGTVRQRDEFLSISLELYDRAADTLHPLGNYIIGQDELGGLGRTVSDDVAQIVIGREWGSLEISGITNRDAVYLNEDIVGFGARSLRYLPVGEYEVTVRNPAVPEDMVRVVNITARQETEVVFDSIVADGSQITVTTTPIGASLYADSIWQGFTPVDIITPEEQQIILLRRKGYFDTKLTVGPDSENQIHATLKPAIFDQSIWLTGRRDRFYTAFTAFILSVPLPIIFGGIYDNALNLQASPNYSNLSVGEQTRVNNIASIGQVGQLASLFVSSVLLVNTIVEIVEYVRAAEFYHQL